MNYNNKLQTNNSSLEDIIDKLNKLPDAGGVLQDKTVTPTTSNQLITADSGYGGLGAVTIVGDANLIASNIKAGVSIFGIVGTYEGNASNLINFTIGGTSYQAEEGMTWGEWVASDYNTGGFTADSSQDCVVLDFDWVLDETGGMHVSLSSVITNGYGYGLGWPIN